MQYYSVGSDSNFPNGFFQQYASLSTIYSHLGVNGATLSIHPFSYHPDSGYISVLREGWFELRNEKANFVRARKELEDAKGIKSILMRLFFDNYHRHDSCILDTRDGSRGDFLIVAADSHMASHLDDFIKHKNSLNYNTKAIYLDELKCKGNPSLIKYYIDNNDSLPNPDYVLLVGSLADIPAYSGTDDDHNPYSDDGYHPFIGRWILSPKASSWSKIDSIANRTIVSELNYKFYDVSMESFSGTNPKNRTEGKAFYNSIRNIKRKYTDALGINNTLHDGREIDSLSAKDSLRAALQHHPRIFLYRGHGGLDTVHAHFYIGPPYYYTDASYLRNITSPYSIGIGLACVLNSYKNNTNVGTNLLMNLHPACVNYYSATTESNRTANNVLGKKIFSQLNTLYDQLDDFPTSVWFKLAEWNYYHACESNVRNWEVLKYNLMGDPTLPVGALNAIRKLHLAAAPSIDRENGKSEAVRFEIFDAGGNLIDSGHGSAILPQHNRNSGMYIIREILQDGTINTTKILLK